ncbi:MAG TPA: siroheme synthase CysG [Rhodoblastus sp.]|nr:siroheme synthase CysG [Rhodoblastus sp.]
MKRLDKERQTQMEHLPIFLAVKGKWAAVIGGGLAAARRAELLLRAGAHVTVFAPAFSDEFTDVAAAFAFERIARWPHKAAELEGVAVCIVATDDRAQDERAHALAKAANALVNVATRPDLCDFVLPSIVDRSPLVVAISTGGASPILGRMLKAQLESTIPAAYGRLADFVRASRAKVNAAIADAAGRRRFWERALDGPIGEMVLAGDEGRAAQALAAAMDVAANEGAEGMGEVYLVGAGPGDPDLLTFRALRLMQKAEVVLYDRLVDPAIVALARREAERIYVGKRPKDHPVPQEEISDMLIRLAKQGKRVLRLKGGDPFVFGRGGEEIERLAENRIPFQVCPGVTAAIGCSAYSGIPLTHRDHAQACVFVTAHSRHGLIDLDWATVIRPGQTVAVYMGLGHIEELMAAFMAHGAAPDLPAAIVDNGTRPNQRVVVGVLADLAGKARASHLRGPTIVIVGTVVRLREKLDWHWRPGAAAESNEERS